MALDKNKIASAKDYRESIIDMTDEWGDIIYLRSMTVGQQLGLDRGEVKDDNLLAMKLIMATCVKDDGSLLFDDPENDIKILESKSISSVKKLLKACEAVNNLYPDAVEDIAKN